jgi:hypothetical protein
MHGPVSSHDVGCGAFQSVADMIDTIDAYIERHNRDPKPFIWTARATDILAKVV